MRAPSPLLPFGSDQTCVSVGGRAHSPTFMPQILTVFGRKAIHIRLSALGEGQYYTAASALL